MEYKKMVEVDLTTKTAKKIVVGDLLEQENTDLIQAIREMIFDKVKNKVNWKLATIPTECDSRTEAEMLADAIIHFVGGARITFTQNGKWKVSSKGYYHYIGA